MSVPTWWMYYEDRLVNVARLTFVGVWAWFVLCFLVESAVGYTAGSSFVSIPMMVAMVVAFSLPFVFEDEYNQFLGFVSNILEMAFRTVLRCLVLLPILIMVFIMEFVQTDVLSLWQSAQSSESIPFQPTDDDVVHHRPRSVLIPLDLEGLSDSEVRASRWSKEALQ